ncbi:MAG: hypothetical protein LH614_08470, partial [Pyrinomonadaceae bacterium]|nr:hypothetical protein [Pyrinomonadaceae bacterium]
FGATGRVPNFSDEFIEEFSNKLGLEFVYDGENDVQSPNFSLPLPQAKQSGSETRRTQISAETNPALLRSREHAEAWTLNAKTFTPEDVFAYAYAVFHSPNYRSRYAEFLKIDFPRLPLTTDIELFRKLCASGANLVALHLLEAVDAPPAWNLQTDGVLLFQNTEVAAGFPKYEDGKVFINKTTYFKGVPETVWNFHIGGYQVCHKWLKDRKGRTLSEEDIAHYGKIAIALSETIRLMTEIDEAIEEHGGFPLVGSQKE